MAVCLLEGVPWLPGDKVIPAEISSIRQDSQECMKLPFLEAEYCNHDMEFHGIRGTYPALFGVSARG